MNSRTMLALTAAAAFALLPGAGPVHAARHGDDEAHHGVRVHADKDHAWLGVRLQRVDGGLAEALDLDTDSGVLVSQVIEDSPAEKAGLESGDIVLRVGNDKTGTPGELQSMIGQKSPGDEVDLHVLRDGKEKSFTVKLAEIPDDDFFGRQMRGTQRFLGNAQRDLWTGSNRAFLGVMSQDVGGDLGEYFGAPDGGALVSEVVPESPAATLGLRAGDVIVEVDGKAISSSAELRRVVGEYDQATEVKVVWIRDKKRREGNATLELREVPGLLRPGGLPMWERRMDRREAPDLRIDELRREVDELRRELDEMRSKND